MRRSSPAVAVLSLILVGGACAWWVWSFPAARLDDRVAPEADVEPRNAAREERIAEPSALAGAADAATPGEVVELRATIRALEAQISALEKPVIEAHAPSSESAPSTAEMTLDQVRTSLLSLERMPPLAFDPRTRREVDLLERLLERFSEQIDGQETLHRLVLLQLRQDDVEAAKEAIRRWAIKIGLGAWESAQMLSEVAERERKYDDFRKYALIVTESTTAPERVRAQFAANSANSFVMEGRVDDGVQAYRNFVVSFGNSSDEHVKLNCESARFRVGILAPRTEGNSGHSTKNFIGGPSNRFRMGAALSLLELALAISSGASLPARASGPPADQRSRLVTFWRGWLEREGNPAWRVALLAYPGLGED